MAIVEAKYTAEAGHWYRRDGSPAYTIIGKNGKERSTTLRDARKEGLKPSVTMILREAAKPGLEYWKIKESVMAALTLPKIDLESDEAYFQRILKDGKETAEKAKERGNQIHAWIQQGFEGMPLEDDGEIYFHVAKEEIERQVGEQLWVCESSFATSLYGGKVDLHSPEIILDIKTKDTPLDDVKTWDEHAMQIAAYRQGLKLPNAKGGILFVSTKDVAAKLLWIEEEELSKGLLMFNHLCNYWYAKTGLI